MADDDKLKQSIAKTTTTAAALALVWDRLGTKSKALIQADQERIKLEQVMKELKGENNKRELAAVKFHHSQLVAQLASAKRLEQIITADAAGKTTAALGMVWERAKGSATATLSAVTGLSTETLSAFGGLATGIGIVVAVLEELTKGYGTQVNAQLSLASAGGAFTGAVGDMTNMTTLAAYDAARFALNVKDLDSAIIKAARSGVIGSAEITALSRSTDVSSASFQKARVQLVENLGRVTAQVISMGPAFSKTSEGMDDLMIRLRGSGVPLDRMVDSLGMIARVSAVTGITLDDFTETLTSLGEKYRWVGVGLDPLSNEFLNLSASIKSMGGSVGLAAKDTMMGSKLVRDFASAMESIPMEEVIGMTQMRNPGMGIGTAIREAFAATPMQKAMMRSELYLNNMQGSSKDEIAALLTQTAEFKSFGKESLDLASILVDLGPHLGKMISMTGSEQSKYLQGVDKTIAERLQNLSIQKNVTTEGLLQTLIKEVTTIESILMRFLGGWIGKGLGAVTGLGSGISNIPTTSTSLEPGTGRAVTPTY